MLTVMCSTGIYIADTMHASLSPMAKYFVCVQPEQEVRCGDMSSCAEFKQLAQRKGKGNSMTFGGKETVAFL